MEICVQGKQSCTPAWRASNRATLTSAAGEDDTARLRGRINWDILLPAPARSVPFYSFIETAFLSLVEHDDSAARWQHQSKHQSHHTCILTISPTWDSLRSNSLTPHSNHAISPEIVTTTARVWRFYPISRGLIKMGQAASNSTGQCPILFIPKEPNLTGTQLPEAWQVIVALSLTDTRSQQ